ncbi:MAG: hypothetical protein JRG96_03870, partial [Deltaproteobacteria bacterium]|nr:hypothetical protein [Deltaproteobacteria bacterium]
MAKSSSVALLAFTLLVAMPVARAHAQPAASSIYVTTGHVAPELEPIGEGVAEWIRQRIARTGLDVVPGPGMRSGVTRPAPQPKPSREKPTTGALLAHASKIGSVAALLVDLRWERGKVLADFRLYEVSSGQLYGGGLVASDPARLIVDSEAALAGVYEGLGMEVVTPDPQVLAAHGLDELSALTRALVFMEKQALVRSWRELEGRRSTTAVELRREILATAASGNVPLAERARLGAVQGEVDGAWSLIAEDAPAAYMDPSGESAILIAAGEI